MEIKNINFGNVSIQLNGQEVAHGVTDAQEIIDVVLGTLALHGTPTFRGGPFELRIAREGQSPRNDPDRNGRRVVPLRGCDGR